MNTLRPESFGHAPDGTPVQRIALRGGGLTAHVLTLGGIVQDLRLDGVDHPLVVGAQTLAPYLGPLRYTGALCGRFANRIAGARFDLGGQHFDLSANFLGRHCLHGGASGMNAQVWSLADLTDNAVTLTLTSEDGDMGFPGRLTISARISLDEGAALAFDIQARTSAPTPVSITHHGYFNLDGGGDVAGHSLRVLAETALPVDAEGIPTSGPQPVAGTRLDFQTSRPIGLAPLDHNFCLFGQRHPLHRVARLTGATSGLAMDLETTEPGLQIYNGAHLPSEFCGLAGPLGPRPGLALEPQVWPDAPNRPEFPDATLHPGQTYHHQTRYVFHRS